MDRVHRPQRLVSRTLAVGPLTRPLTLASSDPPRSASTTAHTHVHTSTHTSAADAARPSQVQQWSVRAVGGAVHLLEDPRAHGHGVPRVAEETRHLPSVVPPHHRCALARPCPSLELPSVAAATTFRPGRAFLCVRATPPSCCVLVVGSPAALCGGQASPPVLLTSCVRWRGLGVTRVTAHARVTCGLG